MGWWSGREEKASEPETSGTVDGKNRLEFSFEEVQDTDYVELPEFLTAGRSGESSGSIGLGGGRGGSGGLERLPGNLKGVGPVFGGSFDLNKGLSAQDYLFKEDFQEVRKKGWAEQLVYLGGMAYLTGASIGGSHGLYEGLKSSRGKPTKLRVNAILNAMGKRGSLLANAMGVLAIMFSGFETLMYHYTRDDQMVNYIVAGAGAGALFKSTAGRRMAAVWALGIACASTAGIYASRRGIYGRSVQGIL